MARRMAPLPPTQQANEVNRELGELTQGLMSNPDVERFSLQVNNRTGVVSANVKHQDGRVQHKEWISRGLSQATQFNPNTLSIQDRNEAVRSLLNQGLTQTEVAKRIGISQSRIAQIKKSLISD